MRRRWWWAPLLLVVAAGAWAWAVFAPYGTFPKPRLVELPAHSSSWRVARQLRAAGVIRSAAAFELWVLAHPHRVLKAGWYQFAHSASMPEVAARLARGDVYYTTLVVPEGFNRFDIARALERNGIMPAASFLAVTASPALVRDLDPQAVSLEGYLFPDTYRIPPHAAPESVAEMMVRRFRQEWDRLRDGMKFDAATGPVSLHEWLTIASLVEKETAVPSERAVIAGIFYNRLRQDLPLQCDPTVIYAALLLRRADPGTLHAADLRMESPYNTYRHAGLPPGPIANPGAAALMAAAHPAATPYLYFVSNGAGGHRFARTLREQDHNILLYLRATRKR
ncbi:MAG: endolytic transglycosylase MltG [Terriglobales bacterium]